MVSANSVVPSSNSASVQSNSRLDYRENCIGAILNFNSFPTGELHRKSSSVEELAEFLPATYAEQLLFALLKRFSPVSAAAPGDVAPLTAETGTLLGYFVPAEIAHTVFQPRKLQLTQEQSAELAKRIANRHLAVPLEQAIDELKQLKQDRKLQET